jgi:hypothetical protein
MPKTKREPKALFSELPEEYKDDQGGFRNACRFNDGQRPNGKCRR